MQEMVPLRYHYYLTINAKAMLTPFLHALFIIFILVTLIWRVSVMLTNVSIVDLFWGLGFVIVNAVYYYSLEEILLVIFY